MATEAEIRANGNPCSISIIEARRRRGVVSLEHVLPTTPPEEMPKPAVPLGVAAERFYSEVVELLGPLGILSRLDRMVLTRYCWWWEQWVCMQTDPEVDLMRLNTVEERLGKLERSMGLNPAARAGIMLKVEALRQNAQRNREIDVDAEFLDSPRRV